MRDERKVVVESVCGVIWGKEEMVELDSGDLE